MKLAAWLVGVSVVAGAAVASGYVMSGGLCRHDPSAAGSNVCASGSEPSVAAGKTSKNDPAMAAICQKSCATRIQYKPEDLVAQPGARPGDLTQCPVSGVVFKVGLTQPTVTYCGASYRFCCSMCARQFKAHPARFLS